MMIKVKMLIEFSNWVNIWYFVFYWGSLVYYSKLKKITLTPKAQQTLFSTACTKF